LAPASENVLLVAADAATREALSNLLEGEGHVVTSTESTENAVSVVRTSAIGQVVLLADEVDQDALIARYA